MLAYLSLSFIIYAVFVRKCILHKYFIYLLFGTLLFVTYGIKPILSCQGYYVVYDGCRADGALPVILLLVSSFQFAALIDLPHHKLRLITLDRYKMELSNGWALTILAAIALYKWRGIDSFQAFTVNRLEAGSENALLGLLIGCAVAFVIISVKNSNLAGTVLLGLMGFAASGQKVMLLLPVALNVHQKLAAGAMVKRLPAYAGLGAALIVVGQALRSAGLREFNVETLLLLLAIPFDAFDNAAEIMNRLSVDGIGNILLPSDPKYFLETITSIVPRSIWTSKPVVSGFWRIQQDYLPLLYSGTDGMSVSISMPVDIIMSFGLVLGVIVVFSFAYLVRLIDQGDVELRFAVPLLILFSHEFSRGGFRSMSMSVLGALVMYAILIVSVDTRELLGKGWRTLIAIERKEREKNYSRPS